MVSNEEIKQQLKASRSIKNNHDKTIKTLNVSICSCGKKNPADASFCQECGKKLEDFKIHQQHLTPNTYKNKICPVCRTETPSYGNFCSECGNEFQTDLKSTVEDDINSSKLVKKVGMSFINVTEVPKLVNEKRGKAKYLIEGSSLFAEETAINFYENHGYSALWTENHYWWFLMALLFWEEIFARIKGAVVVSINGKLIELNPNQPEYDQYNFMELSGLPNDFFKPEFYQRRKQIIASKFNLLRTADLKKIISDSYKVNYGKICRPIENWDGYTLEELLIPIERMDKSALLEILQRLISNFSENRMGLPDLIVYDDKNLFFSEVKSENDRVSGKQREWHQFLTKRKIGVEIFLINHSEKKLKNIKSSYDSFLDKMGNEILTGEEIEVDDDIQESINYAFIIFLERANGHEIGSDFPQYFKYEYNADTDLLLKKALQNNYLTKSDPLYNVERSKVNEIKIVLKKHNLKVSGNKKDLIERIYTNLTEDVIKNEFLGSYYILTEKGKKLVKENDHIIYYHNSKNLREISLNKYHNLLKDTTDNTLKYNTAIKLLKENALIERKKGNWGLYRNSLSSIAKVYEDKNENVFALNYYLKVCILDLSGLSNGNRYSPQSIFLAPGILSIIKKLMKKLELDDDNIKNPYYTCFKDLNLPKNKFSKEESFNMLIKEMNGL